MSAVQIGEAGLRFITECTIQWRKSMKRENFRKGMKDGVPIALGYFAVSFTFGMMLLPAV